jgi:opacity protein-like surface antigen
MHENPYIVRSGVSFKVISLLNSAGMTKPIAQLWRMLGSITALVAPSLSAHQVLAAPPTWTENPAPTIQLQWLRSPTTRSAEGSANWTTLNPTRSAEGSLNWTTLNPTRVRPAEASADRSADSTTTADPTTPESPSPEPRSTPQNSPWIVGLGGGARIGAGEPTYPMVYGRLGRLVDENVALSVRPRYIFGNVDRQGRSNSEGAFQMPFTLDFAPGSLFSPYLGGGIATNTDSTGKTNGMISGGVDLSINNHITIDLGANYIFQQDSTDSNNRDIEFTSVLYYRF